MVFKIIASFGCYMLILCQSINAYNHFCVKNLNIKQDTIVLCDTTTLKYVSDTTVIKDSSIHVTHKTKITWLEEKPTNPQLNSTDTIISVVKGYSPFTNLTDTFYFKTSVHKETKTLEPLKQKQNKAIYNSSPKDSAYKYIYDYPISFTKTDLIQTWHSYLNDHTKLLTSEKVQDIGLDNNHPIVTNTEKSPISIEKNSNVTYTHNSDHVNTNNKSRIDSSTHSNEIEYFIQIAASRTPLSEIELTRIIPDSNEYRKIYEDNWHKYQLHAGNDYQTARKIVNRYQDKKCFLVAYNDNRKLNLWETIKHIELQPLNKNEIVFVVQIAASRTPLSKKEENALFSPTDIKRIIKEDGWYKYQVFVGSSYSLTIQKLKLKGMLRSFPVAYLNNQKIEMSKALKMIRKNK